MGKTALANRQLEFLKKVSVTILKHGRGLESSEISSLVNSGARTTIWRNHKSYDQLLADGYLALSGNFIELTKVGRSAVLAANTNNLALQRRKWDGVWRVVAYDVPEAQKKQRDYFRRKLKEAGFKQVQDSLWVTPHACHEEVVLLVNDLGISDSVAIMTTDKVPDNARLLKYFNLN